MIRVTTLYAAGAGASAAYYTGYLTKADGELPGVWAGSQTPGLGLSREVTTEALEALLSGYHPTTGMSLGRELVDRPTATAQGEFRIPVGTLAEPPESSGRPH